MLSISIQPVYSGREFIFNETQICCSLIKIMRHVFFLGPKKKFSEIYRQFRFWGQNLFFQVFARTFFSIVYNFVKNWPILTNLSFECLKYFALPNTVINNRFFSIVEHIKLIFIVQSTFIRRKRFFSLKNHNSETKNFIYQRFSRIETQRVFLMRKKFERKKIHFSRY